MLQQDARSADWLAAVARRHSRRSFSPAPTPVAALDALEAVCVRFVPYNDARTVLVRTPGTDIFKGIVGSYGKVTGAPHALLFIGDSSAPFADQHVGYTGQAAILEATALDLATCWVGGFFDPKRAAGLVKLARNERIVAVSPVGTAVSKATSTERTLSGMAGASGRKSLDEIAPGDRSAWPDWAVAALETARLAPSAVNRQPWRFRFENGGLVVSVNGRFETPKVTKRLDCGIAMLHVELAAFAFGITGGWSDLSDGLDVARFRPTEDRP